MGIYVKFYHDQSQIWSCHVTLAAKFENFYFLPDSLLNSGKVTTFGEIGSRTKKLQAKTPVLIGLSFVNHCLCPFTCMTQITEIRAVHPSFLAGRLPALEAASQSPYYSLSIQNCHCLSKIIKFS